MSRLDPCGYGPWGLGEIDPPPPTDGWSVGGEAPRPFGRRLAGVVAAAEALPVGKIVSLAAVATLDDVVGEEACRRAHRAPLAAVYRFAAIPGATLHSLCPSTMFRRQQFGISNLGRWLHGTGIDDGDSRRQLSKLAHTL